MKNFYTKSFQDNPKQSSLLRIKNLLENELGKNFYCTDLICYLMPLVNQHIQAQSVRLKDNFDCLVALEYDLTKLFVALKYYPKDEMSCATYIKTIDPLLQQLSWLAYGPETDFQEFKLGLQLIRRRLEAVKMEYEYKEAVVENDNRMHELKTII